MKPIFKSNFNNVSYDLARINCPMIENGSDLYLSFLSNLADFPNADSYMSIPDIHECLHVVPYVPISKRLYYSMFKSGIVIGAGSGNDCIDLLDNNSWILVDLIDKRMRNVACGYENNNAIMNIVNSHDGDTLVNVKDKHIKNTAKIDVIKIDNFNVDECEIVSIDTEGSGLDVLIGAAKTIKKFKPSLLVSIYHNWIEYLLVIPLLYDMGYTINIVKTSNPTPQYPYLELAILATWEHNNE